MDSVQLKLTTRRAYLGKTLIVYVILTWAPKVMSVLQFS